ncbi:hypothetical protein, partial [Actinomadura rubrisoli]
MIILSGVLVVVAIALLVAGIVAGNGDSAQVFGLDALVVIYISIAVSIVSALCLSTGVFLRRKELFGAGASPSAGRKPKSGKRKKPAPTAPLAPSAPPASPVSAQGATAPQQARPPAEPADDEVEIPVQPVDVPEDALVFVVRGRKRYHLDTCRQLAGRDTEELTYVEAKEEGFSPCTACLPDTALAARAAVSVPASSDAGKAAASSKPGGERSASRPESGLSGLAQPPYAQPSSSTSPLSLDKTSDIPRPEREETARGHESGTSLPAWSSPEPDPLASGSIGAHARPPAEPTRTDLPAPAPASSENAPSASEAAETAKTDPEVGSAPERPSEPVSASEEATSAPG